MNRPPSQPPVFRYVLALCAAYLIVLVALALIDPSARSPMP